FLALPALLCGHVKHRWLPICTCPSRWRSRHRTAHTWCAGRSCVSSRFDSVRLSSVSSGLGKDGTGCEKNSRLPNGIAQTGRVTNGLTTKPGATLGNGVSKPPLSRRPVARRSHRDSIYVITPAAAPDQFFPCFDRATSPVGRSQ